MRTGHVVRVHHAVDEADQLPPSNQGRLPRQDRVEQRDVRFRRIRQLGVVSGPRVVRQRPRRLLVLVRGGPLHGADYRADADDDSFTLDAHELVFAIERRQPIGQRPIADRNTEVRRAIGAEVKALNARVTVRIE